MGYITHFSFELIEPDDAELAAQIEREITAEAFETTPDKLGRWDSVFEDGMKWYEWHNDCMAVSRRHPEALFLITGDGEESGDIWACFFRNGESEEHRAPEWQPPRRPTKEM